MKSPGFSPELHYLKYTARRYSWIAIISLVLMAFHTFGGLFIFDTYERTAIENPIMTFYFIDSGAGLTETIRAAAVLTGMFFAAVLFGFLWRKTECQATLALGVSLRTQFLIRYLFGAIMLILTEIISFALSYFVGLSAVGVDETGLCLRLTLIYSSVFICLSLCVYTVAVITAILSGRVIDYILSFCGIIAAPYAIGYTLKHIFANFLQGSSLGLSADEPVLGSGTEDYFKSIFDHLFPLGSLTAFSEALDNANVPASGDPALLTDEVIAIYREELTMPWSGCVVTLVLTVIIVALACLCFMRRPAEYSGRAGVFAPLHLSAAAISALGIASMMFEFRINRYFLLALFSTAFFISFIALASINRASVKHGLTEWKGALCVIGTVCLCALICFFGAFGYSEYQPDIAQIDSVVVNYIGNPVILRGSSGGAIGIGSSSSFDDSSIDTRITNSVKILGNIYWWTYLSDMPVLTEQKDIEKALAIHSYVIKDGMKTYGDCNQYYDDTVSAPIKADWYIVYNLKDGTRIERYYKYLSLSSIEKICSIEESDAFNKNYIDKRLGNKNSVFDPSDTDFEICDEFFSKFTLLNSLTHEQEWELFEALTLDFADLSYDDRYFSDDEVLGVVRFANYSKTGAISDNIIFYRDVSYPEAGGGDTWYITEKYTRTLAFLNVHGLMSAFEGDMTVISLETQEFSPYSYGERPNGSGLVVIQSTNNVIHTEANTEFITLPESEWNTALDSSRAIHAVTRGGKLLRIVYLNTEGETQIMTRLIP